MAFASLGLILFLSLAAGEGDFDPEADAVADAAPVATDGVTSYPPSFFAEFTPVSAMSMVTRIPGFSFDSGGNARGFSGNAGNVLIDGQRPPTGADNLSAILSRIPASVVLRIDVIRGGAPGIDMQGQGMIANVIRKPGSSINGSVQLGLNANSGSGGVSPSLNVNAQRQENGHTLDGSASANQGHGGGGGDKLRVAPSGTVLQQTSESGDFEQKNYNLTAGYERPLVGGKFRINTKLGSNQNKSVNDTILIIPGGIQTSTGSGENTSGEIGARYSYALKNGTRLEGVFLQQLNSNTSSSGFVTPGSSSLFESDRTTGQSVAGANFVLPQRGNWSYNGGGEMAYNWFETGSRYGLNGSNVFIPGDTTSVNELRGEIFAATDWRPRPDLNAGFALRYERSTISAKSSAGDQEKTLGFFKPRVNVSWRPAEGHEIAVTLQRTVGQLSFSDFAVSVSQTTDIIGASNTDIEPEKTWVLDARYEYTFGRRGSVSLQGVHRDIDDVLARTSLRVPASGSTPAKIYDITANVGQATRDSLRFSANLPLERFGFTGGYLNLATNWNWSHIEDPVTGVSRRITNDTPFDWDIGLSQELRRGALTWSLGASGEADTLSFAPRSTSVSSGNTSINGQISYRPRPDIILSANARGALGQRTNVFVLYTEPRDTGAVKYTETSHNQNNTNLSVSIRRQF